MRPDRVLTVYECVRAATTHEMNFPQIVAQLAAIGVERYHVDYSRLETTFYFADGESLVTAMPHDGPAAIGEDFLPTAVSQAIGRSQRNEHTYADFVRQTMAAGCVGYFVHIAGRHAVYFGRHGQAHVEPFPTARP